MLILKESASFEYMVKNSRFLSEILSIQSPEQAKKMCHEQKLKYGMTHLVYAFISGPSGEIMGVPMTESLPVLRDGLLWKF